jgi:cytochrome c556
MMRSIIFGFVFLVLAPALTLPLAASEPEDIIKYRQDVMKTNGANMAASAAIIRGLVPEYRGRLGDHAQALTTFLKDVPALFPKDSDFGDTDALDTVWTKRAEFEKRARDTEQKAAAFAQAVRAGNDPVIAARFKELSDSCRACHKDFRREKQ